MIESGDLNCEIVAVSCTRAFHPISPITSLSFWRNVSIPFASGLAQLVRTDKFDGRAHLFGVEMFRMCVARAGWIQFMRYRAVEMDYDVVVE